MSAPSVELTFNPTDLRPRDLPKIGEFLGTPSDAIEAALTAARLRMIDELKTEVRGLTEPTHAQLLRAADVAWQIVFWRYRQISAPVMADAYIRAYRAAGAGDVPMSVIYDLADKHAEKIGDYFHSSSRDALAEGFNTMVNRRVPAKAAADRVLDAYGLTPRQMRGFTSNKQFQVPVESISPLDVKARARAYIDRSFTQRVRKLARQEEHNIDQQAQQFAWMWMQDKGKLSQKAQKLWITARDERVCPVCGPLHGQKVGINDQFKTSHGQFWTPGLHPNCRCVVRLIENRFSKVLVRKDDWDPKEHPRGGDPKNRGRFSRVADLDKPVIETPSFFDQPQEEPEPEKFSLGTGEKFSLSTPKFSMGSTQFEMGSPSFSMGEKKFSMGGDEKFSMGDKFRLSREEIADQIKLEPQMKLKLIAETEKFLLGDAAAYARPSVRERKLYHKPTIFLQDVTGKEQPYYAVLMDDGVPNDGWTYQLNHETDFRPNAASVASDVVEMRERKIVDAVDELVNNLMDYPLEVPGEEHQMSPSIDVADLEGAVRWLAGGARPGPDDQSVTWRWALRGGGERELTHRYSEIIDMLGDRAYDLDLDVKVLRLDEAHNSRKGQTVHRTAGAFQGKESWITEGDYTTKKTKLYTFHSEPGNEIKATVVYLDPDIEEEELPSIFGGE